MYNNVTTAILSLLVIFVLIGQSVLSYADSCVIAEENEMAMDMSSHDHVSMNHSQEEMAMLEHDMPEHDCCDNLECTCVDGTCSSTLIASLEQNLFPIIAVSTNNYLVDYQLTSSNNQSLIRPPILV